MSKQKPAKSARLAAKFTHNKELASTIYYHRCKFTRKLFVSSNRRATYSPDGLRLKQEQDRELKAAAKRVCKVYFYLCPITSQWFTTQKAGSRFAPESKAITHAKTLDYARQHRQEPNVKERERVRMQTPERKEYKRQWDQRRKASIEQA